MTAKSSPIKMNKVFSLERNPYCTEEQIYSLKIRFEIGFHDYVVTISSGYGYGYGCEVDHLKLTKEALKELTLLQRYLDKILQPYRASQDSWSYLSLSRDTQISHFWRLAKDICGDEIQWNDWKDFIKACQVIEEKASLAKIQAKLAETTSATN